MVPTLLSTLADQAHNTTSTQFTMFHEIHQQNLKVCTRKCDESIQKCHTHSENSKNEFSFLFVEFAVICEGSAASLKRSARQFRYYFLMHVNFTDQRLGRIWSRTSTSTWTLSKQVIPLVSRHDIHRSCVGLWNLNLLRSVLTPFPLAKRMKARSFDSASWTNSANFFKARLLLWISIYINAFPWF